MLLFGNHYKQEKFSLCMDKRGISAIVATVLTILIIVVGVGIIWVGVLPMINKDSLNIKETQANIMTSEGYTVWDEETGRMTVQVGRDVSEGEDPIAVDFIFVIGGTSITRRVYGGLEKNQRKVYAFYLGDYGKPERIKIALVYGNPEKVGKISSEISEIPSGDLLIGTNDWLIVTGGNNTYKAEGTVLGEFMVDDSSYIYVGEDIYPSAFSGRRSGLKPTIIFISGVDRGKILGVVNGWDNMVYPVDSDDTADILLLDGKTDALPGDKFQIYEASSLCGNDICEYGDSCARCGEDCGICIGRECSFDEECDYKIETASCVHGFCRDDIDYCGDSYCDATENCETCVLDCGECDHENGNCEVSESCATAPSDCGLCSSRDGECNVSAGENQINSWGDCGYSDCGNGVCDVGENYENCNIDCVDYRADIYTNFDYWATWNGWYDGVYNESRTFLISPIIDVGEGNEQLYHWLTVDYTSASGGRVKAIIGHRSSDNIDDVMNVTYRTDGDYWVESGEEVHIPTQYKNEKLSWVILEVEDDVTINSVNHTYWVGYDTLYGHVPMTYNFANHYLSYRLMYPNNYDPTKSYPLVVSVGGSGGVGMDNRAQMETVVFGRYLFTHWYYDEEFEAFSIVPQVPWLGTNVAPYYTSGILGASDDFYHPDGEAGSNPGGFFTEALDSLVRDMVVNPNMNIDSSRIYFSGFSYGGKSSYDVSKNSPDIWAAVWPVASWAIGSPYRVYSIEESLITCEEAAEMGGAGCSYYLEDGPAMIEKLEEEVQVYKHIPFMIGSGQLDGMSHAGELVCRLINEAGGDCIHHVYPETLHVASAGAAYGDRDQVEWLFNQVKN